MAKQQKCWSETVGAKGNSRVRVYERTPGGPLYIQWYVDGKKKPQALRIAGKPVYDQKTALQIALRVAGALLDGSQSSINAALGIQEPHTLEELLDKLKETKWEQWSESYRVHQETYKKEWIAALGGGTLLTDITAEKVEKCLSKMMQANKWEPSTRNRRARYIVSAFRFAQRKLKWITEEQNLSQVDFLRMDGVGESYEEKEVEALLRAALTLDLRLATCIAIAADTGRRIQAITKLRVENLHVETTETQGRDVELMRITFPGEIEKRGRTSWSYITPSTRALVEILLRTEAVEKSGYLIPNRLMLTARPAKNENKVIQAAASVSMIRMLRRAEEKAGIEHVYRRAFHGIKRASVTASTALAGSIEVAAKQAGTSVKVIQTIYHQQRREDLAGLVVSMEEARQRRKTG